MIRAQIQDFVWRWCVRSEAAKWLGVAVITVSVVPLAAAQTTESPSVRACFNMALVKLSGIPRSELTATSTTASAEGTWQINWQARDGRSGSCQVDGAHQVTRFDLKVSQITTPLLYGSSDWRAPAGSSVWVTTDGGSLNLRSDPGGEVVGMVANGTQLTVTGQTSSEWVQVEGGNWVSQYHLSLRSGAANRVEALGIDNGGTQPATSQPADPSAPRIATPSGGGVHIRSAPDGAVIGSLADGALVSLTGQNSGDWVELQGGGWVFSAYVQQ